MGKKVEVIGRKIFEISKVEKEEIMGIWLVINEDSKIIDIEEDGILMLLNKLAKARGNRKYNKNVRIKRLGNLQEFEEVRRAYGKIKIINKSRP